MVHFKICLREFPKFWNSGKGRLTRKLLDELYFDKYRSDITLTSHKSEIRLHNSLEKNRYKKQAHG